MQTPQTGSRRRMRRARRRSLRFDCMRLRPPRVTPMVAAVASVIAVGGCGRLGGATVEGDVYLMTRGGDVKRGAAVVRLSSEMAQRVHGERLLRQRWTEGQL